VLIAIEGIDGSGKGTQSALLKEKCESRGMHTEILSFPRYGQTLFAKCVAAYLNGEFGDLASVSPQSAALLYAGDRFESLSTITQLAQSHEVLILDRYVASNLAHQAAKMDDDDRQEFIAWLSHMEYEVFGLPRADLTLYLDMPAEIAAQQVFKKKQRAYTTQAADLHEQDITYLARCREVYQFLVQRNADSIWVPIQCLRPDGTIFPASEIHRLIWDAIPPLRH